LKKSLFLYITFLLAIGNLNSQVNTNKIVCQVLDKTSNKPIVYATVMLKDIYRGTHADYNGKFEIPSKYRSKEIIKISSIGYRTKEIKLSKLKTTGLNIIYLTVSNSNLDEIVITTSKKKKRLLAKQIVRKAIKNISQNYPNQPHSYIGYYRDYQQPVGNSYQKLIKSEKSIEYLNVNEGILESFDNGFKTDKLKNKKNQTLLYNFTSNNNFIQDSSLTVPYDNKSKKYSESVYITPLGGNELNLLDLTNAIRNHNKMSFSFTNIFYKDFLVNHFFKVKEITYLDDTPLYKIYFYSLKDKTSYEYAAYGHIYISKGDFAIHKLNYNLYYQKKKNPQYAVTIEYREKRNKMYLNYISFNNFFEATNGNYFKVDKTIYNSKNNVFKISFNRQINADYIEPVSRNFKIYYKGMKLKIAGINLSKNNTRTVELYIDQKSAQKIDFDKEKENPNYANYFTFEIKNLKDINGFKINLRPSIKLNQYRELFVQEVFENKNLPQDMNFVDKNSPLSKTIITNKNFKDSYWINSPLKKSKN